MAHTGTRRESTSTVADWPFRVLAFSDVAPPEGMGGVERTFDAIYPRILGDRDAAVHILALSSLATSERWKPTPSGVSVTRAPKMRLEGLTGLQVATSLAIWPAAFKTIRQFRPSVLHAHTLFFFTTIVAAVMSVAFRIPLVLTVHVGGMDALPTRQRVMVKAYEQSVGRFLLLVAREVICVSDDVAAHVRSLGASRRKISIIPNGVDMSRFALDWHPETPAILLCVGRLILNKGPMDMLEAARILHLQGREFRLQFAGDGPLESELHERTTESGLNGIVEFLGPRDDIACLLARATVFVRPSLTDGMSLALLEAMAAGTPIVATRVSGAAQLITNGENGLLVQPSDPSSLAAAIAELMDDPVRASQLGAAARTRAKAFGWEAVATRTGDVLRHASR